MAVETHDSIVAILIPCFNEAKSITTVIRDFRVALPHARIYVYDNNSSDDTVSLAQAAGATVRKESLQGKGHVIRRMFADVDADVYVLVDGDSTYDASSSPEMIRTLREYQLDLVNGQRVAEAGSAHRPGHKFGNRVLSQAISWIFGKRITDMLSGYKVFSRRFVKSFPCLSTGFEIETEIAVHALELVMPIGEIGTVYRERPEGSFSKLHTVRDGLRVCWTIFKLLQTEKPLRFFGSVFLVLATISLVLGVGLFIEFEKTGLVLRFPTAILCTGLMLLAFLSAACGAILETVTLGRKEQKRMVYLSIPPVPGQRDTIEGQNS